MWLRLAPALTLALLLGPIGLGLAWTVLPAFGHMPSIGAVGLTLDPWRTLFATPSLIDTLRVTVTAGLAATCLSLILAVGFCAVGAGSRIFSRLSRLIAPLLATPHSAIALGFAFLVLPSGWIVRAISPELTGWTRPPVGLVTTGDTAGLSLVGGLLLKEVPYLVLMMIAASAQVPVAASLAVSRSLSHRGLSAWVKVVMPQIYPQIRLPLYAVLAFSLSVVDVAIILGPSQPPPLSLLATRWFSDYDLSRYPVAAAAAVLQLVVVIAAIGLWRVAEIPIAALGLSWIEGGSRGFVSALLTRLAGIAALLAGGFGLAAILGMVVWSLALIWRFPDAWPSALGFANWSAQSGAISPALANTAIIGTAATVLAIVLVLACLENEVRHGQRPGGAALWLLFVPLLAPQIAFLFGVQVALVQVGLDGTLSAVIWSHLIFVLPYVFLSLADPFRALDPRLPATAAALGAGPMRVFATIKLPLLLRPLLVAVAVGFAVSVGQYLATLFPGAGRISTLTTDAVTLASGADRRIIGVYAALQATLPLLVYAAALGVPALLYRHRQALHP